MIVKGRAGKSDLSFLVSQSWWAQSLKSVFANSGRFLLPALVLAFSNSCSLYADICMKGGIDLGALESGQIDLQKMLNTGVGVSIASILGLVSGLMAMSYWLMDLTAFSRFALLASPVSFAECMKDIKVQSKHLAGVWMVGTLYLLGPVLPLSVLIAFSVLGNFPITVNGEPIFTVPEQAFIFMNAGVGLLSLITIDYSVILIVVSAINSQKPGKVATLALDIFLQHPLQMSVLNLVMIILCGFISAPFVFGSVFPQFVALSKNLVFGVGCHLWLAFSSLICWPLTLLCFVEFSKPLILETNSND